MAELAGEEWTSRAHVAACSLSVTSQERSPIGALLLDILMLFWIKERKQNWYFTREVVGWLNSHDERPWWLLRRGNQVTDIWLAQQLRPYGIAPKTVWIDGEQGKGYTYEQCEETFKRYIPRAEVEAAKAEMRESSEERKKTNETIAKRGGDVSSGAVADSPPRDGEAQTVTE